MLACLWPRSTALGNGSVLETRSLLRVGPENSLFGEKWAYTLLRCKEILIRLPIWEEEGRDPAHFSMWKPRWDSQQSSFFGAIQQGKVAYPLLQRSQRNCLTHTCSIVRLCCPGLEWLWFLIHWHVNNGWKWASPSFFLAVSSRTTFELGSCGD